VQLPAFLLGTLAGMSIWSVLYASLGGASRTLLEGGADLEVLLVGGCKGGRWCCLLVGAKGDLRQFAGVRSGGS
jgi:hypothetical protein